MFLPVVLAGGSGSRLWPLSRQNYPKQFLPLSSQQTMLQETLARLQNEEHLTPIIVTNEAHRFIVAEQLRQALCDQARIILEPLARNTAPAITLAALTQAIHDFETHFQSDPEQIRQHAQQFSTEQFKAEFQSLLDQSYSRFTSGGSQGVNDLK